MGCSGKCNRSPGISSYLGCVYTHIHMHTYINIHIFIQKLLKWNLKLHNFWINAKISQKFPCENHLDWSCALLRVCVILLCCVGHLVHFSSLKACLFHLVLASSSDDSRIWLVTCISLEASENYRLPDPSASGSDP